MDTGIPNNNLGKLMVAGARLGKAVSAALDEYIAETIDNGHQQQLLDLPETLKDFGLFVMHATDHAEWSK